MSLLFSSFNLSCIVAGTTFSDEFMKYLNLLNACGLTMRGILYQKHRIKKATKNVINERILLALFSFQE